MFFWQTRNGGYVLSKTKIISFIVFLFGLAVGLVTYNTMVLFTAIILGLILEIPTLAIGFALHKLIGRDSDVKPELPKKKPKKEKKNPQGMSKKLQRKYGK